MDPKKNPESGQAITEYILLLSIILVALGVFVGKISGSFYKKSASYGGYFEKQIRTGAAPASIWTK
jgi:hypothetical protein